MALWFRILTLVCLVAPISSLHARGFEKFWDLATITGEYHGLLYMLEPQLRTVDTKDLYEQFLFNSGGGIHLNPQLQFWLGQTYANLSPYNAITDDVNSSDLNEYRLWQQLFWNQTYTKGIAAVRLRLEERHSLENAPWSLRMRERGYWTTPITDRESLVLSDECLENLNRVPWVRTKTIDQNRAYIGILHTVNAYSSFNVSYMNQTIFRTHVEVNHAIVLNIFITIPS